MKEEVQVKTVVKVFTDKIKAGVTWFRFISSINDINLTNRELQLLSFINLRGTISSLQAKEEFCKMFETSTGTVSNMTAKLLRQKVLIKEKSKIRINPFLRLDLDKDLVVRLYFNMEDKNQQNGNRD
jgi:hypothetical protein